MQIHPDAFSSILCHIPERLSAETVCDLFTIHSSSDVNKVESADFWMGYLQDVESKYFFFLCLLPCSGYLAAVIHPVFGF